MENHRNIMPNSNIMPRHHHQAPPLPPPPALPQMENHRNNMPNRNYQAPTPPPPPPPPQMENHQFRDFWVEKVKNISDFKSHPLPLSRIKKVMKSDPEVHKISADAPILFAKACEIFIADLTTRSWLHAEEKKRRTLQKSDISAAVERNDTFDFLVDVVPENESLAAEYGFVPMPQADDGVPPYYYPSTGMVMGTPVVDGSGMFVPPEAWPGAWAGVPGVGDDGAGGSGGNGSGEI